MEPAAQMCFPARAQAAPVRKLADLNPPASKQRNYTSKKAACRADAQTWSSTQTGAAITMHQQLRLWFKSEHSTWKKRKLIEVIENHRKPIIEKILEFRFLTKMVTFTTNRKIIEI